MNNVGGFRDAVGFCNHCFLKQIARIIRKLLDFDLTILKEV